MNLLLKYSGFRWIWSGQLLSQMGNAIFSILGLWEIQLKSPFLLSIAGLVIALPSFLGMVGGVFVDRYDARKLMLYTDIMRGIAVLGGLIAVFRGHFLIPTIIVLLGINQLGTALFSPAENVMLPVLVASEDLVQANGIYSLTSQMSASVGSALGGAAVAALGVRLVFGLNMASFWASAIAVLLMMQTVRDPRASWTSERSASLAFLPSLKEGMMGFRHVPALQRVLPAVVVSNFAFAAAFTMMPYWIRHQLHQGALWYGIVDASWALGMVVGGLSSGLFARWPMKPTMSIMSLLTAASVAAFAVSPLPWIAAALILVSGFGNGVLNALFMTLLQRIIPAHMRGRVFGLIMTFFSLATPLGSLAAGLLLNVLPLYWSWALGALSSAILGIAVLRQPGRFEDLIPMNISDSVVK